MSEATSSEALGSRSTRKNGKQPTQEELDLTAALFGTASSAPKKQAAKGRRKGRQDSDGDVEEASDDEEDDDAEALRDYTGLEDVQDDQVSKRIVGRSDSHSRCR